MGAIDCFNKQKQRDRDSQEYLNVYDQQIVSKDKRLHLTMPTHTNRQHPYVGGVCGMCRN